MKNTIRYILTSAFLVIGFVLAPIATIIRSVFHYTILFSNKMMQDLYPVNNSEFLILEQNNAEGFKTINSECCGAGIRAKMNGGDIDFFYCDKCKKHIDGDEFNNKNN